MYRRASFATAFIAASLAVAAPLTRPEPARADIPGAVCGVVGSIGPGWLGKACGVVTHPGKVVGVVKKVLGGKPGQALKLLLGGGGRALSRAAGIAAIVAWAVGGAHFVLTETATLIGQSTSPELTAAWFSSVYWRVAGVGALLTLPFLVAAALQAVLRSDGALLARAVFGYLPLSFIATGAAAPVAMILLRVTDWMGGSVAGAAGNEGSHFLVESGVALGALGVAAGSPFVTFLIALLTAAGGLVLWLELLIRAAAVYVVVLMLPLIFSAMVWPARRVWAVRAAEVLVALILAKFAIVSVLALAAAALGHSGGSLIVKALAGMVLLTLGAFAPWVLLRLLPLAEAASAAAGHVREHTQARLTTDAALASQGAATVGDNVASLIARMQRFQPDPGAGTQAGPSPDSIRASRISEPGMEDEPAAGNGRTGSTRTAAATAAGVAVPAPASRETSHSRSAAPGAVAATPPDVEQPTTSVPEAPVVDHEAALRPHDTAEPPPPRRDGRAGPTTSPGAVEPPPPPDDPPPANLPPTQPDEDAGT